VWAPELLRRLEEKLPWVRPGLALGYGMTETNGLGTSLRLDNTYTHPDSIGRPSATMQVEIRDPDTHAALPDGQVGEIAMRSGATFLGYWRNPEATAKALDADRWYHTGDFGHARDGYVYLEGRRQDLIIRGGENIYPVEIENRLIEHPGVAEVAVVGVTHATLGHEVASYVVEKVPGTLAAADIREWCSATLAGFKVPTLVEFVPELPHNASGKVLKHLLGSDLPSSDFVQE
jgi:acyl-CoA synthetase (AMP-forming)/AMP-acid ligase II